MNSSINKILVFIILLLTFSFVVHSRLFYSDSNLSISSVKMNHENTLVDISIIRKENKNILFDNSNNEVIEYKKNQKTNSYSPVYLRDLDDYYLVVYSKDNQRNYNQHRLIVGMANDRNRDKIYVVNKTSGKINNLYTYIMEGWTLDLSQIKVVDRIIIFPILHDYDSSIFSVGYMLLNKGMIYFPDARFFDSLNSYYQNPDTYIINYEFSNNYIYLMANNNGNVVLESLRIHTHSEYNEWVISRSSNKRLENEEYVKKGYFTKHNGDIYYIDNDLNINKLISLIESEVIIPVIDLQNWKVQIEELT